MFKVLLAGVFAWAQMQGDVVDLEKALNARDKAYFYGTENIKFTLPKGTKGKVEDVRKFSSGNSGLLIEIQDGPKKGEKVWIHFNPKNPSVTCNGKACAGTPPAAEKVVTKREVAAIKNPVPTPEPKSKNEKAKAAEVKAPEAKATAKEPAVTITLLGDSSRSKAQNEEVKKKGDAAKVDAAAEVKRATERMKGLNSPKSDTCPDGKCNVANAGEDAGKLPSIMTGEDRSAKCESKDDQVGQMKISQSYKEGRCKIYLYSLSEQVGAPRKARSFDFRSDGELEIVDPSGARQLRLFPRVKDISYSISPDRKQITVQSASNMALTFDAQTGSVEKVTGARSFNYRKNFSNGRVDKWGDALIIEPDDTGLVLDTGYEKQMIPEQHSNLSSTLRRADGKTCVLANGLLYDYQNPNGTKRMAADPSVFRFKKDADFEQMYNSKCKWK